jgi:hypothetical protein
MKPRLLAVLATLALLAACSATKLAYNRLDWLAAWEVGKFIDLEGPSKARFRDGFATLWQWHRATQLSAYARDLRELADAAQGPLTRAQIEDYVVRANEHGERLFDEVLPPAAAVLRALDDAQVAGMLEKMTEQRDEDAGEDARRTPEDRVRSASRGLRRWFGSQSDAQAALLREWVAARRDDPELWQRYGRQWATAFERTLATRAEPDFEIRLRTVFRDPQLPDSAATRELRAHNRAAYVDLLARLAPTLSAAQRQHLRKKLLALAEDLEHLAAQSQTATRAGAGAGRIG